MMLNISSHNKMPTTKTTYGRSKPTNTSHC